MWGFYLSLPPGNRHFVTIFNNYCIVCMLWGNSINKVVTRKTKDFLVFVLVVIIIISQFVQLHKLTLICHVCEYKCILRFWDCASHLIIFSLETCSLKKHKITNLSLQGSSLPSSKMISVCQQSRWLSSRKLRGWHCIHWALYMVCKQFKQKL